MNKHPENITRSLRDRRGRIYSITNIPEVYREKRDAGEIVFSEREMEQSCKFIARAGDQKEQIAALLMDIKDIFRGSYLERVEG